jgi:hypothetical protein
LGWASKKQPVALEVTACSLNQLEPTTNALLKGYDYKDIRIVISVKEHRNTIVLEIGEQRRRVCFFGIKKDEKMGHFLASLFL